MVNQKFPEGTDPKTSMQAIMAMIRAMSEKGQLPDDKNMEDISSEW